MDATLLSDEMYKVERGKKRISLNVPIQIGFTILSYAKLRMLEFYYDCLCKYIPRNKFECIQMDTDSLYFGLAHENLQDAVYPHLKSDFVSKLKGKCSQVHEADSGTFFPRTCCLRDEKFCRRSPGLFKKEFSGESMIALCSKTYIIDNEGQYKVSCKGVNKNSVSDPVGIMTKVLQDRVSQSYVNRGFRAKDNTMFTYSQQRVGFNYFYCKRKVESDGIHTSPLDLVLSPWPDFNRYTFEDNPLDPLCNSFAGALDIQNARFISVDHFMIYSSVKFHRGEEQASAVREEITWTQIVKYEKKICTKLAWNLKLPELLEDVLNAKYLQCSSFKNSLDSIHADEIVYANKNSQLGCGMQYAVAVLTPSKNFQDETF